MDSYRGRNKEVIMRTVTNNYFESKVRLERINENGEQVKFNEIYTVNALSFSECEAKVEEYIAQIAQGEFDILTEVRAKYKEIFYSDKEDENLWYKASVIFITLDERSQKEKRSKNIYLVQGKDIESARRNVEEVMNGSMIQYSIDGLNETAIQDIIGNA